MLAGLLGIPGVDGRGIGIAVVDSGIAPHLGARRIASSPTSTSSPAIPRRPTPTDTALTSPGSSPATRHRLSALRRTMPAASRRGLVSSMSGCSAQTAAASRATSSPASTGSSPTARVYNIRVINLSLGHPVMEACATDPLCEAVNQAVQAGIVVVVAAGNAGKAPDGRAILGGISSPANSPYAITVGALNTWGTVDRSDDTVATFSSRGPSAYDLAVKPDIAAPGVKILSLQADGALLPAMYPSIHVAGSGDNAYMYLSGTSLAAPIVSGGVALLLQGSPNLSPAQVKFALQNGATAMTDAGLMGAGAGSVNFWASRQIAVYGGLAGAGADRTVARCWRKASRCWARRRSPIPARASSPATSASARAPPSPAFCRACRVRRDP